MENTVCKCHLCTTGNYNPADYQVNVLDFKRERPVGVSGLMRVKNEARWVAQCIDSCIEALDELIICYQDCSDETPEIIEQKRRQYPDKIRVFYYAPFVYAHDLSKDNFEYACNLPEDSIHLLSNYYNYTLSKATYRYAVKIDADQIYFTKFLIDLCDAYRCSFVKRQSISGFLAFGYFALFVKLSRRFPEVFFRLLDFFPFKDIIMDKYLSYLYTRITQTKLPVALSGINLCDGKFGWGMPAFSDCNKIFLFNGCGDTLVFEISDKSYYFPSYQTIEKEEVTAKIGFNSVYTSQRIIESFYFDGAGFLSAGFCWFHMKFVGQKEMAGHPIYEKIDFNSLSQLSLSELYRSEILDASEIQHGFRLFFLCYDKDIPSPTYLIK